MLGLIILAGLFIAVVVSAVTTRRNNRAVPDNRKLWNGRDYVCPHCKAEMARGWVLCRNGMVWSPLRDGRPGALSRVGDALPNTQSMHLRTASNMAWHCPSCSLILVDHDKLVN